MKKPKYKIHPFCLEASELQLLQGWKTAPYQDRWLLPKRTSNSRATQKADDVDDRGLSDSQAHQLLILAVNYLPQYSVIRNTALQVSNLTTLALNALTLATKEGPTAMQYLVRTC